MSKLSDVKIETLEPTRIEGLYVADVPLSTLDELEDMKSVAESDDESLSEKSTGIAFMMLDTFARDENGEKFTDIQSVEDVRKIGARRIKAYLDAIGEVIDLEGKSSEEAQSDS